MVIPAPLPDPFYGVADLPGQAADLERTGGRFHRNPHHTNQSASSWSVNNPDVALFKTSEVASKGPLPWSSEPIDDSDILVGERSPPLGVQAERLSMIASTIIRNTLFLFIYITYIVICCELSKKAPIDINE